MTAADVADPDAADVDWSADAADVVSFEAPRGRSARRNAATRYEIRDPSGELVAIHERRETATGKAMTWRRADGRAGLNGTPVVDLPLYGSEAVAGWPRTDPVVVAEGEKAAAALRRAGIPALGTVTGAASTPSPTALEFLRGRDVVLWPDHDEPGGDHMQRVAEQLLTLGCSVSVVDWPDAPEGGDAADLLDAGTVGDARGLIARARRILSPEEQLRELLPQLSGDFRELLERGYAAATAERSEGGDERRRRATGAGIDAADLLALELAPLSWVVPDLVPEGTTILASPPKVGKSCLVYQVCVEAAVGGDLFGRRVTPGSVLYLALEDGQRRGQDRLRAALAGRTMPRGRLEVRWSSPTLGAGLEADLIAWLDAHPDAVLVAIDTLQKTRGRTSGNRNAYEVDVEDLGRLQSIFRDRQVALVIVHHAAKAAHDDFLASVSGTYGITGSADTIIVIRRKRRETFGTILVTGRDVPEAELSVRFDGLLWSAAPAALAEASFERAEVYRVIVAQGPLFPAAIAKELDLERTSVQHMVSKLYTEGAVTRTPKGYAAVADEPGLARPRVDHVPVHSNHWESDRSDGGHARVREAACASCGAEPSGTYRDGSPRFDCGPHDPVFTDLEPQS